MRLKNSEVLKDGIMQLGLSITADMQDKMLVYLTLLNKWNKVYNLTAIRDYNQMVSNHLLDSLSVLPYLWPSRWLDVGCGAGLPGLVLAVAKPDWQFVLLDSNSKKTSFVRQAVIELALDNVSVHNGRIENWQTTMRFDGIISRAFCELGEFLRSTNHLAAPQGRWAAMKGEAEQEIVKMPDGWQVEKFITLCVPGVSASRSLVIATCKGTK